MSLKFAVAASLTVLCGVPAQADDQAANLGPIEALTSPFSPESAKKPDAGDAELDVATKLCRYLCASNASIQARVRHSLSGNNSGWWPCWPRRRS